MKTLGETKMFDPVANLNALSLGVTCMDSLPNAMSVPERTTVHLAKSVPGRSIHHVFTTEGAQMVDITEDDRVQSEAITSAINTTIDQFCTFNWTTPVDRGNDAWLYDELVLLQGSTKPVRGTDGTCLVKSDVRDQYTELSPFISNIPYADRKNYGFRVFHHFASGYQTYTEIVAQDVAVTPPAPEYIGTIAPFKTYVKAGYALSTKSGMPFLNLLMKYTVPTVPGYNTWVTDEIYILTATGKQVLCTITPTSTYNTLRYDANQANVVQSNRTRWVRSYTVPSGMVVSTTETQLSIPSGFLPVIVDSTYRKSSTSETITYRGYLYPANGYEWFEVALTAGLGTTGLLGVEGQYLGGTNWSNSQLRGSYEDPLLAPSYWPHQIWITEVQANRILCKAVLSSVSNAPDYDTSTAEQRLARAEEMWAYMSPGSSLQDSATPIGAYRRGSDPVVLDFSIP